MESVKMKKHLSKLSLFIVFFYLVSIANTFANEPQPNIKLTKIDEVYKAIVNFINLDTDFFGYNPRTLSISQQKINFYDDYGNLVSYGFHIINSTNNDIIGYVITSTSYDMDPIIEAGKGSIPIVTKDELEILVKSKIDTNNLIQKAENLYNGPLAYITSIELKNGDAYYVSNISKEWIKKDGGNKLVCKPQLTNAQKIENNKRWDNIVHKGLLEEYSSNSLSNITYASTQPAPPTGGYDSISYPLDSTYIQKQLGPVFSACGYGPSAGALLLWHLGERNSSYSQLKWGTGGTQVWFEYNSPTFIGIELCGYMSPIGGTKATSFNNGLKAYAQAPSRNYTIPTIMKYKGTALGSGANTSSNVDVWNTIKDGINNRNAPVALGIGNDLTSGSSYYIEENIPSNFSYHWVAVSGYIDDRSADLYNWYVKCKSWGIDYYCSFNSLCYWRDSLAAIYIDVYY